MNTQEFKTIDGNEAVARVPYALNEVIAIYGNVYVVGVSMGAKDEHTLKAFLEAEAYDVLDRRSTGPRTAKRVVLNHSSSHCWIDFHQRPKNRHSLAHHPSYAPWQWGRFESRTNRIRCWAS